MKVYTSGGRHLWNPLAAACVETRSGALYLGLLRVYCIQAQIC